MFKKILTIFGLVLVLNITTYSQALFQPDNLNFEKGIPGLKPPSWSFSRKLDEAGLVIETSEVNPAEGDFCVLLTNPKENMDSESYDGNALPVYQVLDALPYRNKTIKLSASARIESDVLASKGQLWVIGRLSKDSTTVSMYQDETPIKSNKWQRYEITFKVPAETNELRIGILLKGPGKLWADDFKLEVIQPTGSVDEPAKEIGIQELKNLTALTKLWGYLNFFNPAGNLNTVQNEELTFWAISNAEKAKNDKELISFLDKYSKILSPVSTVNQLQKSNEYKKPQGTLDYKALVMQYKGGPVERADDIYSANIANVFATTRKREASVVQIIEALKYKNKKIKISASIKVQQASPGANAQIWAKAERIASKEYVVATSINTPAMADTWRRYEMDMELPDDIYTIKLALVFLGEGKVYFDDVRIDVIDNEKKTDEIPIMNQGFESLDKSGLPLNWMFEPSVLSAGYMVSADDKESTKGKTSLVIESEMENRIKYPIIGEIYSNKIADDIYLHHPYIYYADNDGTLPKMSATGFKTPGKPSGYQPNVNDRYTRLASVIKLWNTIKHFGPSAIDDASLDSVLTFALSKASKDNSTEEFLSTLRSILLVTNDIKAIAWSSQKSNDYTFPLVLREISNRTYVSIVVDTTLGINAGDELTYINDKPVSEVLSNNMKMIPGDNLSFKYIKALAEIRAGDKGTSEMMTFKKADGSLLNIKLVRSALMQNIFEPRPIQVVELDSGYVYIDLTGMDDARLKDFIEPLAQRGAYIFDMRGFSSISEHFLNFFTKDSIRNASWEIPVYTFPNKENISKSKFGDGYLKGNGKLAGKKIIFLTDERTTGYAEAIISVAKAGKIGKIAGTSTSGSASEAMPIRLYGDFNVSFAGLSVYSPDGKLLFGKSIEPDIEIKYEISNSPNQLDNVIQKALQILKN